MMDEKILEALTKAAMIHKEDGIALSEDLAKIHKLLDSAANSELAQGTAADDHQVASSLNSVSFAEDAPAVPLRRDETTAEDSFADITKQSKRHDEPYNSVPRVV